MNLIQHLKSMMDEDNLWDGKLNLSRGDLLKEGVSSDSRLFFILNGCIRVAVEEGEEEHTIRLGYTGNFITALDAFITENESDFRIEVLKKTNVLYVSRNRFYNWINQSSERLIIWQKMMEGLILQQIERERDILTANALQRYKRVLNRSPQVFQEVPHKYIASYLRMTPETLSRLKKE